jgi:antimicrobial peptide system SdpA family protein
VKWALPLSRSRRRRSMTPTVIVGVVYACLLAAAGTLTLAATLPSNIIWERTQLQTLRVELNTIAGQSFAFFTRSPQTEQIVAYRLLPDGTIGASLMVTPQGTPANLFGVSRTQRAQGPELANLVQDVEPRMWLDCTGLDRRDCLDQIARAPKALLRNTSPVPTVCGQVVLAAERTTKWAYRRLSDTGYVIHQIVPASIDCPHSR